jgi:ferric-dicitrate binding protein FerR (iron transport regulator)
MSTLPFTLNQRHREAAAWAIRLHSGRAFPPAMQRRFDRWTEDNDNVQALAEVQRAFALMLFGSDEDG